MGLGISLLWQEQPRAARPLLEEAARYAEQGTDIFATAMSQFVLGVFHTCTAQYADARPHYYNALRNTQRLGDLHGTARTLWWLGDMARLQGDAAAARGYYTEGVALARQTGLLSALAHHLFGLGELDCQGGAVHEAQQECTQSLRIFETIGEGRDIALARLGLARVAFALGQQPTCDQQLSAAAEAVERIDTLAGRVQVLRRLVEVLSQVGRTQLSERLDAALEQHRSRAVGVTHTQEALFHPNTPLTRACLSTIM